MFLSRTRQYIQGQPFGVNENFSFYVTNQHQCKYHEKREVMYTDKCSQSATGLLSGGHQVNIRTRSRRLLRLDMITSLLQVVNRLDAS